MRIVRDRDEAEDVVQEALLKVCRSLTRFEGRAAFSTWLHRIVVNAALDRLRRHQTRRDRVSDDDDLVEIAKRIRLAALRRFGTNELTTVRAVEVFHG